MCEISRHPMSIGIVKIALPSLWMLRVIEVLYQFEVANVFRRKKYSIDELNEEGRWMLGWNKGGKQCHAFLMIDDEDHRSFMLWYITVQIMSMKFFIININMEVRMMR